VKRLIASAALPGLWIGLAAAAPVTLSPNAFVLESAGPAQLCADHARLAADGKMTAADAVATCDRAVEDSALSARDLAASHNNRGVVRLTMPDRLADARADFEAAATIQPLLGETYVNHAAVLIQEKRYAEAVADLGRGLELGVSEPWKAYYNRAVAREAMDQLQGAYEDYKKAAELKPDWDLPKADLARFTIRRR
jgi:tetratricopeptide (TPR) repeat protein